MTSFALRAYVIEFIEAKPMKRTINRLRATLEDKDTSLTDLAELTGLPYEKIRRMSRSDSNPKLDDALRVAAALQTTIEDLFRLVSEAIPSQRRHVVS